MIDGGLSFEAIRTILVITFFVGILGVFAATAFIAANGEDNRHDVTDREPDEREVTP